MEAAKRLIKQHAPRYRWARELYEEELRKKVFERDLDALRDAREAMILTKSLLSCTASQYANIVRFERECARRKVDRKINRELSVYADWAANGLPVQKEKRQW